MVLVIVVGVVTGWLLLGLAAYALCWLAARADAHTARLLATTRPRPRRAGEPVPAKIVRA